MSFGNQNGSVGTEQQIANAIQSQGLVNQFSQATFNAWQTGSPPYVQTAAELAAGITPTNYAYPQGHILRYGTNTTPGTTDMTAALQAACNQHVNGGPAVYAPRAIYALGVGHSGTTPVISVIVGGTGVNTCVKITGDGWANDIGTLTAVAGTIFRYVGSGAAPVFSFQGQSPSTHYIEGICLRDFAIDTAGSGTAANATGIQLLNAPFTLIDNVFIGSFQGTGGVIGTHNGVGIEQGVNSWGCTFRNVKILGCTTCLFSHDAGEDSTYITCTFRNYLYTGNNVNILMNNQAQNNTFIGCDISESNYGVIMGQGDSNGNGTGTPLSMQANFVGGAFENCKSFAIGIITSNQSFTNNKDYPTLTVQNVRFFCNGGPFSANNGNSLIYIQACAQVEVGNISESGYSYGATIGISAYTYTVSGTAKPGPIIWKNDNGYTYGTGRFQSGSLLGSVVTVPGDHAIARFTSASLSYTSGNFTQIPYSTIVSDAWGWYQSFLPAVQPTKNSACRFRAQIYIDSATAGRYQLFLYKNGSQLAYLADITIGSTQPLLLAGEYVDTPSGPGYGTGDYYSITTTANQNFTLDTNSGRTWFTAEVAGE